MICAIAVVGAGGKLSSADDKFAAGPEQNAAVVADYGLCESGAFWICRDEVELRRQLELLPARTRPFFAAQKQFDELINSYQRHRDQLARLQKLLDENIRQLSVTSLGSQQRQQLENENSSLTKRIRKLETEVAKRLNALDEFSLMTEAAIELVNRRNALAITLLAIERRDRAMRQRYQQLAEDPKLAALLHKSAGRRLGPAEKYSLIGGGQFQRLTDAVFTSEVPVYRRSGQIRLSLILNERAAVTFNYSGPSGPLVVPSSALAAAGVRSLERAKREQIDLDGRKVMARVIEIPSVRVGQYLFKSVPAYALPPETEDLGGRISAAAFPGYVSLLMPERLSFRLAK